MDGAKSPNNPMSAVLSFMVLICVKIEEGRSDDLCWRLVRGVVCCLGCCLKFLASTVRGAMHFHLVTLGALFVGITTRIFLEFGGEDATHTTSRRLEILGHTWRTFCWHYDTDFTSRRLERYLVTLGADSVGSYLRGATSPNTLSPKNLPTLPTLEESHFSRAESAKNSCLWGLTPQQMFFSILYVQKVRSAHSWSLKRYPVAHGRAHTVPMLMNTEELIC
jgi:hypothetical protein